MMRIDELDARYEARQEIEELIAAHRAGEVTRRGGPNGPSGPNDDDKEYPPDDDVISDWLTEDIFHEALTLLCRARRTVADTVSNVDMPAGRKMFLKTLCNAIENFTDQYISEIVIEVDPYELEAK